MDSFSLQPFAEVPMLMGNLGSNSGNNGSAGIYESTGKGSSTQGIFAALLEGSVQNAQSQSAELLDIESEPTASSEPASMQELMDSMQKMFESLGLQFDAAKVQEQLPQIADLMQSLSSTQEIGSVDLESLSQGLQELGFIPQNILVDLESETSLPTPEAGALGIDQSASIAQSQVFKPLQFNSLEKVAQTPLESLNGSSSDLAIPSDLSVESAVLPLGVQNAQVSINPQNSLPVVEANMAQPAVDLKLQNLQTQSSLQTELAQKLSPLLQKVQKQFQPESTPGGSSGLLAEVKSEGQGLIEDPSQKSTLEFTRMQIADKSTAKFELIQPEQASLLAANSSAKNNQASLTEILLGQAQGKGSEQSLQGSEDLNSADSAEEQAAFPVLEESLAQNLFKENARSIETNVGEKPVQALGNVSENTKATPTDYLESKRQVDVPSPIHQVSRQMTVQIVAGVQSMRLILNPEHLGGVEVNVQLDGDKVQLHLSLDHEEARKVLEKDLVHLRQSLESQNLKLDKIELSVNLDQQKNNAYGQGAGDAREQGERQARQGQGSSQTASSRDQAENENTAEEKAPKQRYYGYNHVEYTA